MGVLRSFSFCLRKPGEPARGLRISDGNPPDAGVCKQDAALGRLSKPAAAMVAVAVAEAMVGLPSWMRRRDEEGKRVYRPLQDPRPASSW